jgi:hypothetical protein
MTENQRGTSERFIDSSPAKAGRNTGKPPGPKRKWWIWLTALGAAAATAIVLWAVNYVAPVKQASEEQTRVETPIETPGETPGARPGAKPGAKPDLLVRALHRPQFDSPMLQASSGEHIWPMSQKDLPEDRFGSGRHEELEFEASSELDWKTGRKYDAADAETTAVRLNVRGSSSQKVTIHKVTVRVISRKPPLRGVWETGPKGGDVPVRYLTADLDQGKIQWIDSGGHSIGPKPIYVTDVEEENLDILASTKQCDCRWVVDITYTVAGGEPQVLSVTNSDGKPWRTSGTTNAAEVYAHGDCKESPKPGASLCNG